MKSFEKMDLQDQLLHIDSRIKEGLKSVQDIYLSKLPDSVLQIGLWGTWLIDKTKALQLEIERLNELVLTQQAANTQSHHAPKKEVRHPRHASRRGRKVQKKG